MVSLLFEDGRQFYNMDVLQRRAHRVFDTDTGACQVLAAVEAIAHG